VPVSLDNDREREESYAPGEEGVAIPARRPGDRVLSPGRITPIDGDDKVGTEGDEREAQVHPEKQQETEDHK
jgi:hypothetical protein